MKDEKKLEGEKLQGVSGGLVDTDILAKEGLAPNNLARPDKLPKQDIRLSPDQLAQQADLADGLADKLRRVDKLATDGLADDLASGYMPPKK